VERISGETIDDSASTSEIKMKILAKGFLKGQAIRAEIFEGWVVLSGGMDNRVP
jgi:osmotically-inducible protein OsmY